MFYLSIIIYSIGIIAILLTLLPFLKFGVWWIRIGDFPRIQIIFLCLTIVILTAFTIFSYSIIEIIFIIALIICIVYQMFCVLPYLPIYPKQVENAKTLNTETTIKLLIFNVLIENKQTDKLLKLVKQVNPDTILLAEPDNFWIDALEDLKTDYPFSITYPLDNAYGIALFSRLKIENSAVKFIIEDDIPSIQTQVQLASGDMIDLFCLHPRPPIPPENDRSDERDAELIVVGKKIGKMNSPTIVAGDLNDVAWSRTTKLFQKLSNLLDPRIGRGLFSSFHADHWFIRFPLDHVFHSNHFRLVELKRLPNIGSDHFPIFITLNLEKTAEFTQTEPTATKEEKEEAEEIVNKVKT